MVTDRKPVSAEERIADMGSAARCCKQCAGVAGVKHIRSLAAQLTEAKERAERFNNRIIELLESSLALRAQLAKAGRERDAARCDSVAASELLNSYNLGGWTDAIGPMKRAIAAEAKLERVERAAKAIIEECSMHKGCETDNDQCGLGDDIQPLAEALRLALRDEPRDPKGETPLQCGWCGQVTKHWCADKIKALTFDDEPPAEPGEKEPSNG